MKLDYRSMAASRIRARGVTLIELMVVVAVIAILAAVAYPSYEQYILRTNRAAAQTMMLNIANRQEQYRLDARTYTATIGPGGLNIAGQDGFTCAATCGNGRYTISVALVAGPPPGYTITATPVGNQTKDTLCGTLTLDATGNKTASGNGGVSQCWKQ
jgi:type IV pilus assembly protein PilE